MKKHYGFTLIFTGLAIVLLALSANTAKVLGDSSDTTLQLTKVVSTINDVNDDGATDAGDIITYSYTLTNTSTANGLHNVVLTDNYTNGNLVTVSSCPTALAKSGVKGNAGTCTENYVITAADAAAGQVTSTAVINAKVNNLNTAITSNPAPTTTATSGGQIQTNQQSLWNFDQADPLANSSNPALSLVEPANWSGSFVAGLDGSQSAVYFPGWTQLVNSKYVDPTASSLTVANDDSFNSTPGSSFTVSAFVNPLDPTALVSSGVMVPDDTLNIMQKGLSGGTNQMWKLSVNVSGHYICSFRGPNTSGVVTMYELQSKAFPFGITSQITCSLNAGVVTLDVTNSTGTFHYVKNGPVSVVNTSNVTVGKKPGTNYPGDTFAGTVDDITVTKTP